MPETPERPRLRGVLHQAAFVVAVAVGALLIAYADESARTRAAAAVFAGSVVAMLGASALYHRITWSPRVRPWMRRLDHAGVYLLIAGSYTPVGLFSLHGTMLLSWTLDSIGPLARRPAPRLPSSSSSRGSTLRNGSPQ